MVFLHVLGRKLYHQADSKIMKVYLWFKFKMKIGFECWQQEKNFKTLILEAIQKTLKEKLQYTAAQVQKTIKLDDGVPEYNNSNSEDSIDLDALQDQEHKKIEI